MPFIQKAKSLKPKGCIFCKAFRDKKKDKDNFVLARGKHSVAMLNIYPYNNGHLMVAPSRHTGEFIHITGPEWEDIMVLVGRCQQALHDVMGPQGYNVGINVGRAAGAGIDHHLHVHLVPRWKGDSNFMPVTASVKVLPQSLSESYAQILKAMNKGISGGKHER